MLEKIVGKLKKIDENSSLDGAIYYDKISKLIKEIHDKIPDERMNTKKVPTDIDMRWEHFEGENRKRAVLYLLTNGCEWALKTGNGCAMCGHLAKQVIRGEKLTTDDFIKQFNGAYDKVDFKDIPILSIFNNGSFLNDEEITKEAQEYILKKINRNDDIKMVVLETRPEYVTDEKVKWISELLKNKRLEISIGLEMKDDIYRNVFINKGFTLKQYDRAAAIITKYAVLRSYVLLKPPFLNEKESVKQAIETIEHAFKVGASTVSLEACTVQDFTLVKYLHERNLYESPWLWSIIEVIENTQHLGKLIVGMFKFFPSPTNVPYNCDECSHEVLDAIKKYNETLDSKHFSKLECDCKEKWREEVQNNQSYYVNELSKIFK